MKRLPIQRAGLVWMIIALGAIASGAATVPERPALADGDTVPIHYAIWDQAADAAPTWHIWTVAAPLRGDRMQNAGPDSVKDPALLPTAVPPSAVSPVAPDAPLLDPQGVESIPWLWIFAFVVLVALFLSSRHQGGGRVVAVRVRPIARHEGHRPRGR